MYVKGKGGNGKEKEKERKRRRGVRRWALSLRAAACCALGRRDEEKGRKKGKKEGDAARISIRLSLAARSCKKGGELQEKKKKRGEE